MEKNNPDIIINGVGYRQIKSQPQSLKSSKIMALLSAFSMLSDIGMTGSLKKTDVLQGIDIVKEFELIEQKKSNQPKSVRDAVVHCFNKNFERI